MIGNIRAKWAKTSLIGLKAQLDREESYDRAAAALANKRAAE